jgi:tetratricopeptide (TPR) repeat protein
LADRSFPNPFPIGIGNDGTADTTASQDSLPPRSRPSPEQVGPWAVLAARALAQLGNNQSEFARIITSAAYELDDERGTVHASAVNRWLTGNTPQPRMQRWIAHGLSKVGMDISLDQIKDSVNQQRAMRRQLHQQPSTVQASNVDRRDFLVTTGIVAVSALRRYLFATTALPAIDRNELHVDRLDRLAETAWRLRQRARYGELGDLLPRLLVNVATATHQSPGEEELRRLVSIGVHAHNAASSLLRRVGATELAAVAADRAVQSANELGDPLLQASAQYRLANVLLSAERFEDAKELSLAAAARLEPHVKASPGHLATWGGLLLTGAVAAARQQSVSEAWDLLGRARTAAVWLGRDYADLNTIFGPSNVAIHNVEVASDLGDSRAAIDGGRMIDLDSLPPELLERRATLLINIAAASERQDDGDTALALLLQAEKLASEEVRFDPKARATVARLLRSRQGQRSELRDLARRIGLLG